MHELGRKVILPTLCYFLAWIQCLYSHHDSLLSMLISPYHLRLGLWSDFCHSSVTTKLLIYLHLILPITWSSHPISLNFIILIIFCEEYKIWSSGNIFFYLQLLLSYIFSWELYSFLTAWNKDSRPCKVTIK